MVIGSKSSLLAIIFLGFLWVSTNAKAEEEKPLETCLDLECLSWLAGYWEGAGFDIEGDEVSNAWHAWSSPADGVLSHTFRWFVAETNHVHFSFNVFRANSPEITGKGLHFNRDFENFEDAPWELVALRATDSVFELACKKICEGWIVKYELQENGTLLEQWYRPDEAETSGPRVYIRK